MMDSAASLWIGRTVHRRHQPIERAFHYRVAMISVDIDNLEQAASASPLFSVNSANFLSFFEQDHGPRDGAPLRPWAEERLKHAGIDAANAKITLLTFPRVLGKAFAPLSIWYAHALDGELKGVIYEVHNTFGEAHAYVAALDEQANDAKTSVHCAEKQFHVSPFMDTEGRYRFTLKKPDKKLSLLIENMMSEERWHTASLIARREALSTASIVKHFALRPFSAIGVWLAIHWQALWVWRSGIGYRRRPALAESNVTLANTRQKSVSDHHGEAA